MDSARGLYNLGTAFADVVDAARCVESRAWLDWPPKSPTILCSLVCPSSCIREGRGTESTEVRRVAGLGDLTAPPSSDDFIGIGPLGQLRSLTMASSHSGPGLAMTHRRQSICSRGSSPEGTKSVVVSGVTPIQDGDTDPVSQQRASRVKTFRRFSITPGFKPVDDNADVNI